MKNIKECLVINESIHHLSKRELDNLWNDTVERIGDEKMLNEIYQFLSSDVTQEMLESIRADYDLDYNEDDY